MSSSAFAYCRWVGFGHVRAGSVFAGNREHLADRKFYRYFSAIRVGFRGRNWLHSLQRC